MLLSAVVKIMLLVISLTKVHMCKSIAINSKIYLIATCFMIEPVTVAEWRTPSAHCAGGLLIKSWQPTSVTNVACRECDWLPCCIHAYTVYTPIGGKGRCHTRCDLQDHSMQARKSAGKISTLDLKPMRKATRSPKQMQSVAPQNGLWSRQKILKKTKKTCLMTDNLSFSYLRQFQTCKRQWPFVMALLWVILDIGKLCD